MEAVLLTFAIVFAVNLLPAFGPPTFAVLIALHVALEISAAALIGAGALAAAIGRCLLGLGARRMRGRLSERRRESLDTLHSAVADRPAGTAAGLGLFALSPVPSAQLFVGAGLAGARIVPLAAAFFVGRTCSYTLYVSVVDAAHRSFGASLLEGLRSPIGIVVQVAALAALVGLVRTEWAAVLHRLQRHRVRSFPQPDGRKPRFPVRARRG